MDSRPVSEGTLLWEPSGERKEGANITAYMRWLSREKGLSFKEYNDLWTWSVTEIESFWESLWEYFKIIPRKGYSEILSSRKMPGARWFNGSEINYTEHVFRNITSERPALIFQSEITPLTEISWEELYKDVASIAASLRSMGVEKGDRVVAYMPNIPQTVKAFLACASIGAVWSSCSPDFGTRSVTDRFKQIEPKVLFAVDGYQYGGKAFDCLSAVEEIRKSLTTLRQTILVPYLKETGGEKPPEGFLLWKDLLGKNAELIYESLPFNHPIWVVYSSGTTGLPKGLVHSQGGILIELMKFLALHVDIKPGDRFFWFSTTGWVMWNIVQGGLLVGATPILYDGSPGYPDMDVLWGLAEKAPMNIFGTSAAFIHACMNSGLEPGKNHDLGSLKTMGSTGSPLSPEGFRWVYEKVKKDLLLASVSGGTDPCSGFLGSCPTLPVHAGELQCRCLGVKAEALDEAGKSLLGEVGELVIKEPIPSMPLYLWNDPDNKRYIESYFEMYPGVWRHGDWIKITDRGSAVILGRSDSTLKRMGVRMGSSEIYAAVEELPEIAESLIVGYNLPNGDYNMPLFVVLKKGLKLDAALKDKIKKKIRTALSPRHVPDEIHEIAEVPKTLNGKKLEVPVKKILQGIPVEKAVNLDSMSNPSAIRYFTDMAEKEGPGKKPA
ncbi:MAG: acetoacetate--CoA ligase [Desulfobacteraceae bacterium]|nr:MAG: acetoacetate--CoA ligase [Desulfobacteraceae bacterium]